LEVDFTEFKIIEVLIKATGANPMGEVSDGHICLTGRLKPVTFSIAVICDDKLNHDVNSTELQGSSGDIVGIVYVDVPSDLRDKEEVSCLKVRKESSSSGCMPPPKLFEICIDREARKFRYDMVMGLAVMKIADRADAYRRVGLVR